MAYFLNSAASSEGAIFCSGMADERAEPSSSCEMSPDPSASWRAKAALRSAFSAAVNSVRRRLRPTELYLRK